MALVFADLILIVHTVFIGFIVLGQILIVVGLGLHWHWARRFWLRSLHLAAVALVVMLTWLGIACPLTSLEHHLRASAHEAPYADGFVAYWLHKLFFYQADAWVFTLVYSIFGGLVFTTWIFGPPQPPTGRSETSSPEPP